MRHLSCIACLAVLVWAFGWCPARADSAWQVLEGCTLVDAPSNDGDSFHVRHGGQEYIFRLYFVDAPEADATYPARMIEQSEYFGADPARVVEIGAEAARFTAAQLGEQPFTVRTKWHKAQGRSKIARYYAVVTVGRADLAERLVARGLARVHGVRTTLPSGVDGNGERARLLAIEDKARLARQGAWLYSLHLDGPPTYTNVFGTASRRLLVCPRTVASYSTDVPRRRIGEVPRNTLLQVVEEFENGWVRVRYRPSGGGTTDVYCLRWDLSLPERPVARDESAAALDASA